MVTKHGPGQGKGSFPERVTEKRGRRMWFTDEVGIYERERGGNVRSSWSDGKRIRWDIMHE